MPHKLSGLWRSMLFPDGSTAPVSDGRIFIRINEANNTVDMGSNHEGKGLTGDVRDTADGLLLTLKQVEQDNVRNQSGILVSEEDTSGQKSLVILGHYIDRPIIIGAGAGDVQVEAQNEGTWVITKP